MSGGQDGKSRARTVFSGQRGFQEHDRKQEHRQDDGLTKVWNPPGLRPRPDHSQSQKKQEVNRDTFLPSLRVGVASPPSHPRPSAGASTLAVCSSRTAENPADEPRQQHARFLSCWQEALKSKPRSPLTAGGGRGVAPKQEVEAERRPPSHLERPSGWASTCAHRPTRAASSTSPCSSSSSPCSCSSSSAPGSRRCHLTGCL